MSIQKVNPYCVGLTGNIGSGKSTVIQLFKQRGAAIIIADEVAREVTQKEQPAVASIRQHFGETVVDEQGYLKRVALRDIIFKNPAQRLWLEQLLHPLIRQAIEEKVANIKQNTYCLIEIPLLLKREDYPYLQRVLLVTADRKTQLTRVLHRDKCSLEQANSILESQPDEKSRRRLADDIIVNNGSTTLLEKEVVQLHERYLHQAQLKNLRTREEYNGYTDQSND